MKLLPSRLAVALVTGMLAQTGFAATDPIATVNGVAIPAERAQVMIAEQRTQGTPDSPQLNDAVREELIRRAAIEQAARALGIDKRAEVVAQTELSAQVVLIRAYLQDWVKANPVSDAEIKQEYDTFKEKLGTKEYHARHVLLKTEEEAKALITKLDGGAKFETLAKDSLDPGSKDNGGDLGWANPGNFVPPFSEALVKLTKGAYTKTPVKTDFGYHVILLEDVRDRDRKNDPTLETVKPQIQQALQQQKVEKHILELRSKAEVK
jgi:peptidyl-prolyl cis-trans isomerase C